jgi:hypothetical protein
MGFPVLRSPAEGRTTIIPKATGIDPDTTNSCRAVMEESKAKVVGSDPREEGALGAPRQGWLGKCQCSQ